MDKLPYAGAGRQNLRAKSPTIAALPLMVLWAMSVAFSCSVQAHHTLISDFDVETSFELRGALQELEWHSPHVWISVEVSNAEGEKRLWRCESGTPSQLERAGWHQHDLPMGTVIRAMANPARDGSHKCATRNIFLDDGTPIFTRDYEEGSPFMSDAKSHE